MEKESCKNCRYWKEIDTELHIGKCVRLSEAFYGTNSSKICCTIQDYFCYKFINKKDIFYSGLKDFTCLCEDLSNRK